VPPKGAEPTLGLPREASSGRRLRWRVRAEQSEERLVAAPFVLLPGSTASSSPTTLTQEPLCRPLQPVRRLLGHPQVPAPQGGQHLRSKPLGGLLASGGQGVVQPVERPLEPGLWLAFLPPRAEIDQLSHDHSRLARGGDTNPGLAPGP